MSYAESLERLKNFQKRPGGVVAKVSEPPFETFDTAPGARFQNSHCPNGMVPEGSATPEPRPDSGLIPAESHIPTIPTAASDGPEREKGDFQKRASKAVPKVSKAPHPLDGLPLLPDDRRFIEQRTSGRRDRDALVREYGARWRAAADAEPVEFRRANRGRFTANSWLLEATGRRPRNPSGDNQKA